MRHSDLPSVCQQASSVGFGVGTDAHLEETEKEDGGGQQGLRVLHTAGKTGSLNNRRQETRNARPMTYSLFIQGLRSDDYASDRLHLQMPDTNVNERALAPGRIALVCEGLSRTAPLYNDCSTCRT